MNATTAALILRLFDFLIAALRVAPEVLMRYRELRQRIERWIAEGRDPTPEEWRELDALTEALHERIQQAGEAPSHDTSST